MSMRTTPHFVHRRNRDGSYDAICALCASTAASAALEADLAEGEHRHECDPYLLKTRIKLMQSRPPQPPSGQTPENG